MPRAGKSGKPAGLRAETDSYLRKLALWSLLAWLIFSVVPVGGAYFLFGEHFRRSAILENGARLDAKIVTRRVGKARIGTVCRTVYEFAWAGRTTISDVVGCPDSQPVGGKLAIAFDPAEPAGAFALSQGTWAGRARVFPFVLVIAFAALTWFLFVPALRAMAELLRRRRLLD
jgi:hypothetical protein